MNYSISVTTDITDIPRDFNLKWDTTFSSISAIYKRPGASNKTKYSWQKDENCWKVFSHVRIQQTLYMTGSPENNHYMDLDCVKDSSL